MALTMELAIFAIFALLAVGSAVVVVAHKNPVYSTLSLVLTLFSVAVLFVLLGAPFLGALQILVYAGAIVVLFLFVIMLLNVQHEEAAQRRAGRPPSAGRPCSAPRSSSAWSARLLAQPPGRLRWRRSPRSTCRCAPSPGSCSAPTCCRSRSSACCCWWR